MRINYQNYGLFFRFIKAYLPQGFEGINRADTLILELEKEMENNNQFFFLGDVIKVKILFTSMRSTQMMATEPDRVTPERFFEVRHPDDADKHVILRGKIFKTAHDLYNSGKGEILLSDCTRILNHQNEYSPILSQSYFFYSEIPSKTVYMLEVHTDVAMYSQKQWRSHHYFGNDMSYFRYPDEKLMNTGNIFSEREFQIIQSLANGLNTKQVSEKLFISPYTVNTHRSNILQKSGKANMQELVSWLRELGML